MRTSVRRTGGGVVAGLALIVPAIAAAATGPTIHAIKGTPQTTTVNTAFGHKLVARVVGRKGNPRVGLLVTFKAPTSGASATFPNGKTVWSHKTGKKGYVRVAVTANGTVGSYHVTANLHKPALPTPAVFKLTNAS